MARKSGRNKTRAKQRDYKEHCRLMRVGGYVTDSRGSWTQNGRALGLSDAAIRGTTAK